jgi:hypothetical protein
MMISYASKDDPTGGRYTQHSHITLPSWAVDVKPCVEVEVCDVYYCFASEAAAQVAINKHEQIVAAKEREYLDALETRSALRRALREFK